MEAKEQSLGNQLVRGNGGYELVLGALLLGFFGYWLDGRFGTDPFLMLTFGAFGFISGGVSLYYRFKQSVARLEAETEELRMAAND